MHCEILKSVTIQKKTCTIVFKVHNIEIEFLLENIQMYSISFEIFSFQFRAQPIYIHQDLISFVGRRYNCLDVSAMLSMVIGLILFTLADSSVSPNFNTYGGYTYKN